MEKLWRRRYHWNLTPNIEDQNLRTFFGDIFYKRQTQDGNVITHVLLEDKQLSNLLHDSTTDKLRLDGVHSQCLWRKLLLDGCAMTEWFFLSNEFSAEKTPSFYKKYYHSIVAHSIAPQFVKWKLLTMAEWQKIFLKNRRKNRKNERAGKIEVSPWKSMIMQVVEWSHWCLYSLCTLISLIYATDIQRYSAECGKVNNLFLSLTLSRFVPFQSLISEVPFIENITLAA